MAKNIVTNEFKVKGFHLDLRIQVLTPKALNQLVDEIAVLGLNTLVMEYEATYPYQKHPILSNHLSYSEKEIDDFLKYCQHKNIDVIPLKQCFGHVEYILRHEKYAPLRENELEISQICPIKEKEAKKLFEELFKELVEKHSSKYFHIGGDETYLLGSCKDCQAKVLKTNKSKLYVDYIKMICGILKKLGKTPVMWADIILKHPEAANQLPKDTIFIDWNYGWELNRYGNVDKLQKIGCKFWGSPALRSSPDNYYLSNWPVHFDNLKTFIPYAKKAKYEGMVLTSWSTSGLYSFPMDQGYEVIDEPVPWRHVYPLIGFRILAVAYKFALDSETPIDSAKFVKEYGQNRFGLSEKHAKQLWQILSDKQNVVWHGIRGQVNSIQVEIKKIIKYIKLIKAFKPIIQTDHGNELNHLLLMHKIRLFYLKRVLIENALLSEKINAKNITKITLGLNNLIKESTTIDSEFKQLNSGFLYDSEIELENKHRNKKLFALHDRIFKRRK